MTTLWRHSPMFSAAPTELLNHYEFKSPNNEIYEKAIFLLENDKYLYIRYFGLIDNPNTGITDIEECDTLEEAKGLFDEY